MPNCGTCGHDCQGGACVASKCQPVALATAQNTASALALDATHVYWLNEGIGAVEQIAKTGGAYTALVSGLAGLDTLAVDSTIYGTSSPVAGLFKVPIGGGAPTKLTNVFGLYTGIAVDATTVYASRIWPTTR